MPRDSSAPLYEFFAGGGLARLGLERRFACVFANDNASEKADAYRARFGEGAFRLGDVWNLEPGDLPGRAALAWASFPCQDLSLAGERKGLAAPRSGAFWGFHRLIEGLAQEGRAPKLLALENVCGLLTSRGGADFEAVIAALDALGYCVGALEIDAALFSPQSRRRLFIVAGAPAHLPTGEPTPPFHTVGLRRAVARLPASLRARWVWWRLPTPPKRNAQLGDILDENGVEWMSAAQTEKLLALMSPLQRERLAAMQKVGERRVGAVFRRMRSEDGVKVQRAEARFDGLAGCLRTPAGGSSRQILLFVDGQRIRTRLLAPREAARLMGVPDDYPIPDNRNEALHLFGDAVSVPVVRWLADHLLAPLARAPAAPSPRP
ncbi:MAG: DNA (cytosine-5-)-methyltransferase [Hyphomonadaceae bacterium]|nr:DNA (cytosine-5-)-methyltransferase [Hyphomonadaceae bacterium]